MYKNSQQEIQALKRCWVAVCKREGLGTRWASNLQGLSQSVDWKWRVREIPALETGQPGGGCAAGENRKRALGWLS